MRTFRTPNSFILMENASRANLYQLNSFKFKITRKSSYSFLQDKHVRIMRASRVVHFDASYAMDFERGLNRAG